MKISHCLSTLILLSFLISCNPPVTFTEPQPANTSNLSKFPARMAGEYISQTDQSTLIIHEKFIERIYDFYVKIHSNQLDSGSIISGDSIINPETKEIATFTKDGDSMNAHIHSVDTIFELNNDHILRALKGFYFLNMRYNEIDWEVQKVKLSGSKLMISKISSPLSPENLEDVKENSMDTSSPYRTTMTKKEFKNFVKNDGFNETEIFIRVKK